MSADESALVALVPEAEFLVKPFRDRYKLQRFGRGRLVVEII